MGSTDVPMMSVYERIYAVVRLVPPGRVATYGQVATLAGLGRHARQVGYALHRLPEASDVPWHRVINARGGVSARSTPGWDGLQRTLLEAALRSGRLDLAQSLLSERLAVRDASVYGWTRQAQLFEALRADEPQIEEQIGRGEFGPLLAWLRANIHEQGSLLGTQALLTRVSGRPLDPQPFVDHLRRRYLA